MNISSVVSSYAVQSNNMATSAQPTAEDIENLFSLVDSDSSGGITLDELSTFNSSLEDDSQSVGLPGMESISGDMLESMFQIMDADSDGEVTSDEMQQANEVMQSTMIGGMQDVGGVGGDNSEEEFDEWDTNKDGVVSAKELAAALIKMKKEKDGSEEAIVGSIMTENLQILIDMVGGSNYDSEDKASSSNNQFINQIQQYMNQASSNMSSALNPSSMISQLA